MTAPIFFHTLRNHVRKLISLVAATGLTALLMAATQPAAATPGWDLILKQDAPVIVAQDVQEGVTLTRVFEAVVRNQAGKKVGILVGQQELLEATLEGKTEETRLRTLVFMLKGGQIMAQGAADFPMEGSQIRPGKAPMIAITGGTSAYIGARGELLTTRNSDGSYTHKFRFVD